MNVDPFVHLGEAIRKSAAKCEDNNKDLQYLQEKNTSFTCVKSVFLWINDQFTNIRVWRPFKDLGRPGRPVDFPRYVNPRDDPKFYGDTIQSEGCQLEVVPFSPKVRKNANLMGIGWENMEHPRRSQGKRKLQPLGLLRMFKIWLPSMEIHG